MTDTTLSTTAILTAGKATFTLAGAGKVDGLERRWTFQVAKSDGTNPIYFVSLLTGPDNDADYRYVGVYDPTFGRLRLTKASKFAEDAEPVRGFRWAVAHVYAGTESQIEAAGWRFLWSAKCQRCGRTLTVPSSIDGRVGPECAKKMGL